MTWSCVASYLSGCEPLAGAAHLNIIRCRCEQGPKAEWALLPSPPRVAVRRVKLVETFSSLLFERNASRQLARDFSSGKESRGEEGYRVGGWGLARKEMWCGGEVPGAGVVSHGACPTLYRWAATGKGVRDESYQHFSRGHPENMLNVSDGFWAAGFFLPLWGSWDRAIQWGAWVQLTELRTSVDGQPAVTAVTGT